MNITWKDGAATAVVGVVAVISYGMFREYGWLFFDNWKNSSFVVLLLGFVAYLFADSDREPQQDAWTAAGTLVSIIALASGLLGIALDSRPAFIVLVGAVYSLWVMATLHHFFEVPDLSPGTHRSISSIRR